MGDSLSYLDNLLVLTDKVRIEIGSYSSFAIQLLYLIRPDHMSPLQKSNRSLKYEINL